MHILSGRSTNVRPYIMNTLKVAIQANRLTDDVCKTFLNEMIVFRMKNLNRDEMREIGKMIVYHIFMSAGNGLNNICEQRTRCVQTLALMDRLTICNDDSIWIHYYRWIIYSCYVKLIYHLHESERNQCWTRVKAKYVQMMSFQLKRKKSSRSNGNFMELFLSLFDV